MLEIAATDIVDAGLPAEACYMLRQDSWAFCLMQIGRLRGLLLPKLLPDCNNSDRQMARRTTVTHASMQCKTIWHLVTADGQYVSPPRRMVRVVSWLST